MRKGVLIMGSSPAALQAALDLADANIDVHLAVSTAFLDIPGTTPISLKPAETLQLNILKHPRITLWTGTVVETIEKNESRYTVGLKTHPRYVDLTKCTGCKDCIDVCPVNTDSDGAKAVLLAEGAQPGCAAIIKEGRSPCAAACPGGIHAQGYVALAAQGRFQEAIDLIREAIPFPGIMGRICTHPCELQCRRNDIDGPVSIRRLKRFLADWDETHGSGAEVPPRAEHSDKPDKDTKRVAIVGAGPAGMTAAASLIQWGYRVTVFDKLPVKGGMLAVGIPAYRLPRDIIAREYGRIEAQGVEMCLNTTIGPDGDHTVDDLLNNGFDAVCLALGAHKSLSLNIPGESLPGVVHGIDLLKTASLSQQLTDPNARSCIQQWLRRGKETRVIIMGGGNTAMDVARTVKRLGAQKVRIIYRRTLAEMPALPEEIHETKTEGVAITFLTAPVEILGDETNGVSGVKCIRMKLGEPDEGGRCRPVPIEESNFVMPADLVIPAIGQAADVACISSSTGIEATRHQRLLIDPDTMATGRQGVFAAGDAVTTQNMSAIEAIGMGKRAAASIHDYLQGIPIAPSTSDSRSIAQPIIDTIQHPHIPPISAPMLTETERIGNFNEVERRYDTNQVITEAGRCLACGPCSECLACEKACSAQAIFHDATASTAQLQVDAVIDGGDGNTDNIVDKIDIPVIRCNKPDMAFNGSVTAGRCLSLLKTEFPETIAALPAIPDGETPRTGVFVCQCGGQIAERLDTAALKKSALQGSHVVFAEELPFSCTPSGIDHIGNAATQHHLNRIVLAACTCCALDQACHSCTFQRVRCKESLGLFNIRDSGHAPSALPDTLNLPVHAFDFVNIREHCAFAHSDSPEIATDKANMLISAALKRVDRSHKNRAAQDHLHPTVILLGNNPAATEFLAILKRQPLDLLHLITIPDKIESTSFGYRIHNNGSTHDTHALVLTPSTDHELEQMQECLPGFAARALRPTAEKNAETAIPGLFCCTPHVEPRETAAAMAARLTAWMGRRITSQQQTTPQVDPYQCRFCGTCREICEAGAPQLISRDGLRTSWIDPGRCIGCGTCAVRCPSDAITAPYPSNTQLEATLDAILGTEREAQ